MIHKKHYFQASSTLTHTLLNGVRRWSAALCWAGISTCAMAAEEPPATPPNAAQAQPQTAVSQLGNLYVREYRVKGNHILKPIEIEKAVYPFMGPGRSENDIEQARLGLEKIYKSKGYQTVYVEVPQQTGARGIIYLNVVEAPVGRLRVKGSRYFCPARSRRRQTRWQRGRCRTSMRSPRTSRR
jgi:hemolysin activation/secretion protein